MKLLKDKWTTPYVRYTKVEFQNKCFRRYHFIKMGRSIDVLWLASDREFLPEVVEKKLEKEFETMVG